MFYKLFSKVLKVLSGNCIRSSIRSRLRWSSSAKWEFRRAGVVGSGPGVVGVVVVAVVVVVVVVVVFEDVVT